MAGSASLMFDFNRILQDLDAGKGYKGDGIKYQTLVIDSLTSLFRLWQEAVVHNSKRPALQKPDYGTLGALLYGQFLPSLKSLNIPYTILIDHTVIDQDGLGKMIEFPIGPSKPQGQVLGKEFTEVWRSEKLGDEFVIRTDPTSGMLPVGSRCNVPDKTPAIFSSLQSYLKAGLILEEKGGDEATVGTN